MFIKVSMVRRSRLIMFYFKEKFCVSHASASLLRDVYCLKRFDDLVKKVISPVIIDTNHSVKCFFFKWMFFKVSMAHRSPLVTFYFKEKFRVSGVTKLWIADRGTRRTCRTYIYFSVQKNYPRNKLFLKHLTIKKMR